VPGTRERALGTPGTPGQVPDTPGRAPGMPGRRPGRTGKRAPCRWPEWWLRRRPRTRSTENDERRTLIGSRITAAGGVDQVFWTRFRVETRVRNRNLDGQFGGEKRAVVALSMMERTGKRRTDDGGELNNSGDLGERSRRDGNGPSMGRRHE